jgi:hypothetical protein
LVEDGHGLEEVSSGRRRFERRLGGTGVAQQDAVVGDLVGADALQRRRVGVESRGGTGAGVPDLVDGFAGDGERVA